MTIKEKIANAWLTLVVLAGASWLLIWMAKNPISWLIMSGIIMTIWSIKTLQKKQIWKTIVWITTQWVTAEDSHVKEILKLKKHSSQGY